MTSQQTNVPTKHFLPRLALDDLIQRLRARGYTVIGPTVVDGIISMREIRSTKDLPTGVQDQQEGGKYRLSHGDDSLTFDFVVGPDGIKRYLFPPTQRLMQFHVRNDRFELEAGPPQVPKLALLGVRPCELAAVKVQDRVFAYDDPATFRCESEPWYTQAREEFLYIAVNCTRPGGTCFCASWDTGPEARSGFDLALTELRDGFVVAVGSERGRDLLRDLPLREPTPAELELAELKMTRAREHMGRQLDTAGVKKLLDENIEHPEWDKVAERCLACGNCTMVCPTCFCSTVTDATDLTDGRVTRTRAWESCFNLQFSYMAGGPGRNTIRGRYRHWLRHKLCTWWDQFDTSGCVGCGRCITWCPVGIDLTEEVQRIARSTLEPSEQTPQP
jgi:ferredoxin